MQFFSLDKLLSPLPFDNSTPRSISSIESNIVSCTWEKRSRKQRRPSNGFQCPDRPLRLSGAYKQNTTVSDISLAALVQEESCDRAHYEVELKSAVGLGIDWIITESGLVYVSGFHRINSFFVGTVEMSSIIHASDQLLSINDTLVQNFDLLKIIDVVRSLDHLAKVFSAMF